jgi:hypothetical protein
MKPSRTFARLLALATALMALHAGAQPAGHSPALAMIFDAAPGTNTLLAARDAVRAWRAAGRADAAASIRLSRGQYWLTEPLVLAAQDGNVTWEARDPKNTVISGGRRLGNFAPDKAGIWHAKTGLHFEQLYINGRRATRARSPAQGFFEIQSVTEDKLPDGKARLTIKVADAAVATLPMDAAPLHEAQILVFHKWDTSRYAVSSWQAGGAITVRGERMASSNPWNAQSRFILENSRLMLTEPGSWFLDETGDLSYLARPGEAAGKTEFVAPVIERFVEIDGAADIHFAGLRFHHAGYKTPAEGCPPVQAAARIEAAIQIDGAQRVTFVNVEIAHTGNYGIWFRQGCRDCRMEHCLLEDLGAGGIRIGEMEIRDDPGRQTGAIVVDNNIIRACGRVHPSAVGIWIGQSANNRVTHNDISDTYYTGISAGWTWGYGRSLATNNFIGFNRIHKIGQGVLSDMGAIYTLGVSPGSASVGNVIFDVRAHDYGGWGIYPDEGSTGWRIESNLVWNCTCVSPRSGGGFHQHYGATNYIANNIFAFSSGPPMQATRVEDHLSFLLERNLIVSSNAPFFTGPWEKIQFQSRSNCFAYFGAPMALFPNGDLGTWQKAGHETGSILTTLRFRGDWPDVTLPGQSPANAVGFERLDSKEAGVYGDRGWKRLAREKGSE